MNKREIGSRPRLLERISPFLLSPSVLTCSVGVDRLRAAETQRGKGTFMDPLAIFMQTLAGIATAVAVVSTIAVLMKGSKES